MNNFGQQLPFESVYSMQQQKPMWQTSQQGWAMEARKRNEAQQMYNLQNELTGMTSPEQRLQAYYDVKQRISNQGGGGAGGTAPGQDFGVERLAASDLIKQRQDYFGDLAEKAAQRQANEEQRAYEREARAFNVGMLRKARQNMVGGIGSLGGTGSYRVTGV